MPALPDTIRYGGAGRSAKAIPAIVPSFHENQRGRAFARGLSRARGHGVVHMDHVVEACRLSPRPGLTLLLPVELAGPCARSFFRCAGSSRTRVNSVNRSRSSAPVPDRLPHQLLVNRTADRLHHHRLSSSPSFDGSKKPWKWRQELGKVIQGRGQFTQGGGRDD